LIALINEMNTPLSQIFQGQMSSTVQCSHCKKLTITIDKMQDISLHICTDTSSPLPERLSKLFQPETLEGENAFWCGDCQESHRATKTLACTKIPTILIIHLKRLLPGGKINNHTPFETILNMEPFMTPGLRSAQKMELIGIISHQGTGKNGHYVAATKKGTEWILYDDAITTQLTLAQLHRLQAYVLIYRKTTPNTETGAIPEADTSQKSTEKLVPANQDHKCRMKPLLPPDPSDKLHMEQQQHPAIRAAEPSPIAIERPRENPGTRDIPHTQIDLRASDNQLTLETEGATEPDVIDTPPTEQSEDFIDPTQDRRGAGLGGNELKNLPQILSTFLHLSRGRIEDITSLLSELSGTPLTTEITTKWLGLEPQGTVNPQDPSNEKLLEGLMEDPEDDPREFIPIIEQHNARLVKAHLLMEATRTSFIKNGRRARL
jgi:hypothetical protein